MLQPQSNQRQSKTPKQIRGEQGENIAASYLLSQGYKILERNAKKRYGEIDIVALDAGTLVFVEVKTRLSKEYGPPEEAITPWKIRALIQSAHYFKLTHNNLPDNMRIDLVAIEMADEKVTRIEIIKNISSK